MTRSLPHEAEGYAVELDTHIVHKRYAGPASGLPRTRSVEAVYSRLGDAEPVPCETCWPPPPKTERKRGGKSPKPAPEPDETDSEAPDFELQPLTRGVGEEDDAA